MVVKVSLTAGRCVKISPAPDPCADPPSREKVMRRVSQLPKV
jgi:hypothetical protein